MRARWLADRPRPGRRPRLAEFQLREVAKWVAPWFDIPVRRCTVPKHRNLLPSAGHTTEPYLAEPLACFAHAMERPHEETATDHKDMIYP